MNKKPISLNLKQIDISSGSKDEKKTSNKSNNDQLIKKQDNLALSNESVNNSKSNSSINSVQSSNSSPKNQSPAKTKLKVPFEVKPPTATKTEPKYSKINQNLRLLNQAEETRQISNKNKLNKIVDDKVERALDRSNLKTINTSSSSINQNKSTDLKQQSIKQSPIKQPKLIADKNANRLVDFYLKNLPDPFDYLDNNQETPEIFQIKNQSKDKILTNNNSTAIKDDQLKTTVQLKDKKEKKKLESIKDNSINKTINDNLVSNLSKQFLNNEKNRLENEQLIDIKIKNDYERRILKGKIDKLMKVLINYKLQTYTNDLVDELNDSLDKIAAKSNDNKT